jgi:hypothetical protein
MTEGMPMKERTDYTAAAERIDYTKLEKKLEELREETPPKKRRSAGDVLAPVRGKLLELRAKGWTYAQLTAELNGAGLPVKVGTLREHLTKTTRARKPRGRSAGKRSIRVAGLPEPGPGSGRS